MGFLSELFILPRSRLYGTDGGEPTFGIDGDAGASVLNYLRFKEMNGTEHLLLDKVENFPLRRQAIFRLGKIV